jgi:hypothetical protein
MGKPGLAHEPEGNQPSGDSDFMFFGFQGLGGFFATLIHKRCGSIAPPKLAWIQLIPQGFNLFEFFLTLLKLFARLKFQRRSFRRNCRRV